MMTDNRLSFRSLTVSVAGTILLAAGISVFPAPWAPISFVVAAIQGLADTQTVAEPRAVSPAAAFTPGNLVLYRVGTGSSALAASATAVFLDEYTPGGTLVQSIPMPTVVSAGNRRLTASGTATSEGYLTRSANGQFLIVPGYDAAPGATSIATSSSATVNRVIGRVDASGIVDTTTALTDAINAGSPRSATSTDGTELWISGTSSTSGGLRYATHGATTSTSLIASPTNFRSVNIYDGQLYLSSAAGDVRMGSVGTGTPNTSGQTLTTLPNIGQSGSYTDFFFADLTATVPGVDTLYIVDDTANILQKFSFVSGAWSTNGSIAIAQPRGLTGVNQGTSTTLYITAGGSTLRCLTDPSGYNATITGSVTSLATAATNTAFRGIALAPVQPAAPEIQVTGGPLSFGNQNLGTTSTPQAITVTNTGSANLVLSAPTFSGSPGFAFTNDFSSPIVVAPTTSRTISFTFTPSSAGPQGSTVTINSNASGTAPTVDLSGNGVSPEIDVTPAAIDFGARSYITQSGLRSITIKNTGTADLVVSNVTLTGPGAAGQFELFDSIAPGTSIAAGASRQVRVRFVPAGGITNASVNIFSNDSDENPVTVALSGQTLPFAAPEPTKGLWVFGGSIVPNPVSDATGRATLLSRSRSAQVNKLYVSVYQGTNNTNGRRMYQEDAMAALIAAAHAQGQEVWAAYGDTNWHTFGCGASDFPVQRMAEIAAYNASRPANEQFDGVMLDVEPAEPLSTSDYQDLIGHYECMRNSLPASVKLGAAIRFFWDDAADNVMYPAVGGVTKPAAFHMIDLDLDSVVVMGYRDFAGDTTNNGIIDVDKNEIGYASGRPGLVIAGLETISGQPDNVSFFDEGQSVMDAESELVANHFSSSTGFGGFAIHNYQASYLGGGAGWPTGDNTLPVAVDDDRTTPQDQALVLASSSLVGNDIDPDAQTLTVTAVSDPVNGTVSLVSGTITFTPTAGFTGAASFDYTVSDGVATDTGRVNVAVTAPVGQFAWSSSGYSFTENGGFQNLTIQRTNGTAGTVSVSWGTDEGTAKGENDCAAGIDFERRPGSVQFLDGETSKTISVRVCDDADLEADETFTATLVFVTGGGAIGSPSVTTVTIRDNEPRTRMVDRLDDSSTADECTDATPNDCSLRRAIETANDGDTITFDTAAMGIEAAGAVTITLAGSAISIEKDITIDGPGADKLAVSGNNASGVFEIIASTVRMSGLTVTGGSDSGILVAAGAVTFDRIHVTGNSGTDGGGLRYIGGGDHAILSSTFSNNQATGAGGGINVNAGSFRLTIVNSTISGNSAVVGGGMWTDTVIGEIRLISSTITANAAGTASGFVNNGALVIVGNSIIAGNASPGVADTDGEFESLGFNLIGNVGFSNGFGSAGDQTGNSETPIDPKLASLGNNGGTTPTHALNAGSPAIDQGRSSLGSDADQTDQRGQARPVDLVIVNAVGGDGSDIGAFEMLAPTATRASISGRVVDRYGRGIRGAMVIVQGADGIPKTAYSNTLGYYRIDGLPVGESFVVTVSARRYAFAAPTRFVNLSDDISDLNFTALP